MDADKLVKIYVKMRDKKAAISAEFKKQLDELDSQMDIVESELLELVKSTGGTAIKTEHGTATRGVKTRYWTENKEAFVKFAVERDAIGLIDARVAQRNMASYLEEHKDDMPEGMNVERKYAITVRRA